MAPADRDQDPTTDVPPPLLTIRVSHDSGRTYGPPLVVHQDDHLEPLLSSVWPPCQCPRHRTR